MGFVTADTAQRTYDVIVVGSGAAGGQAAYTLCMEGAKVLMLEAGRNYDAVKEPNMFALPNQAPLRDAATPDKQHDFFDATVDGGHEIPGEPYTNGPEDPRLHMRWWRARMLGGRTNHWGRNCFRNGPYDFQPRQLDGRGVDWPIAYDDMAPYYDRVERLVGVYGTNEPIENVPASPEGILLPPPALRIGERYAQFHARKLGIPVLPIHRGVLTRPQDAERLPALIHPHNPLAQRILAKSMRGRSACFWATVCPRGCAIRANYQSTTVHLPPALDTGNLDILPNAMARAVTVNASGKADGVAFVDKKTGRDLQVRASAVVVAAGSMESVRLLLNSRSALFPQGIGNSHGRLGRSIMDNVSSHVSGQIPALESLPPHNEEGAGGPHAYVPWWLHAQQRAGKLDFSRGYYISFQSGKAMPSVRTFDNLELVSQGSYGKRLREDARRYYGSFLGFSGQGQKIPDDASYCALDPGVKDKWGIPVLRFHWKWGENEYRMVAHMQRTFVDWIHAMGGRVLSQPDFTGRIAAGQPGGPVHEVGGAAMGSDPNRSVTDPWGRTWDVPNVFVADGALFPSNASKNPTQTIMALAWRTADRVLELRRRGEF
jgi:choline dehydrogenase-like flavoprotein